MKAPQMRALRLDLSARRYAMADVRRPRPAANEVLVHVATASVSALDRDVLDGRLDVAVDLSGSPDAAVQAVAAVGAAGRAVLVGPQAVLAAPGKAPLALGRRRRRGGSARRERLPAAGTGACRRRARCDRLAATQGRVQPDHHAGPADPTCRGVPVLNLQPPEKHAAVAEVVRAIGLDVLFPHRCGSPNVPQAADGEAG